MRLRLINFVGLLSIAFTAVEAQSHFTLDVKPSTYSNYMPVSAVVHFPDNTTNLCTECVGDEIAAFSGSECRGQTTIVQAEILGKIAIICQMSVYGHVEDNFRFLYYDASAKQEIELSGVFPYSTGNTRKDLYAGQFAPEDMGNGGHFEQTGSLLAFPQVKLTGTWTAVDLTNLADALNGTVGTSLDMQSATLPTADADWTPLTAGLGKNSLVVVASTATENLRKQSNVVTATEANGVTTYTATQLTLTDRQPFRNALTIAVDKVTMNRPTWVNGGHETCLLPFVPTLMYRADDVLKTNEWSDFALEAYKEHSTTEVAFARVEAGKAEANTPYLLQYKGTNTSSSLVDFVLEAENVTVGPVSTTYGTNWVGCYLPDTVPTGEKVYVMKTGGQAMGKAKAGLVIPPFHCYFLLPNGGQVSQLTVRHESATAIQPVSYSEKAEKAVYNLQGVRVPEITEPGLYIIQGKKLWVEPKKEDER